jgi:hypothetical protein
MVHLTLEHFVNLPGNWNVVTTLTFMLTNFILFGMVAYRTMKQNGKFGWSLFASIWCSMLSILLLIVYAIMLTLTFTKHIEKNLAYEFKQSGMYDIKSYVVNNLLESGSTHLFEAPIIACIFSLLFIGAFRLRQTFV